MVHSGDKRKLQVAEDTYGADAESSERSTMHICSKGHLFRWACLVCCVFAWSTQAQAAGIFFSGNGSVAGGRAGAVVATGNSADSFLHNMANISKLKGFGLRFDNILSFQTARFKRANAGNTVFEEVSKDESPAWIPALSFWYGIPNLGPGTLTVMLFANGPHGRSGYRYPEEEGTCNPSEKGDAFVCNPMPEPGPNRGVLIRTASTTLYFGLGVAYEWRIRNDVKLRIGGAFKMQYTNAVQRQTMIAVGISYNAAKKEMTTGEVILQIDANGWAPTGDAGISLDLPLGFRVGAAVQLPSTTLINGRIDVFLNEALNNLASLEGTGVDIETSFPPFLRAGIGWEGYGLSVEVAFVAELWSQANKQVLKPKNIKFNAFGASIDIPEIAIDLRFKDSYSVRVGAEYNIANWVWVRAGWWYETGTLEEREQSVATIDYPNRMALTGGISVKVPKIGVMVDFSVMHIFGRQITVTDSPIVPTDVSPDLLKNPSGNPSTANGDYTFGNTSLFIGIRGNWGPGAGVRGPVPR